MDVEVIPAIIIAYCMAGFMGAFPLIGEDHFNGFEKVAICVLWPLTLAIITLMFFPKAIQKMSRNLYDRSES